MSPVPFAPLIDLVRQAGAAILPYWRVDIEVQEKADASPVTAADLAAH
ncbi:3'(2'),5'-bisphosphate nucleotidase CysQ, partial [Azotobacter chroococcum]|nr:3'(2'),5'-bisphosphate nucleotidase CysQ [Azotobacter chroococcum]